MALHDMVCRGTAWRIQHDTALGFSISFVSHYGDMWCHHTRHPGHAQLQWQSFRAWHTHAHAHAHTLRQTTVLQLPGFCPGQPGEPVQEETFTHSHLSWTSIIPYLFPPSVMIYVILPIQFTCLTVFLHNLCPSFIWSTSWPGTLQFIVHTFLHPIIVFFSQHMPVLLL